MATPKDRRPTYAANPNIFSYPRLDPEDQQEITSLAVEASEVDGVAPLSEQVSLRLGEDKGHISHLLIRTAAGDLAGYAQLDTSGTPAKAAQGELVVRPALRRHGYGTTLLQTLREHAPGGRLQVWAHGQHAGARYLAAAAGMRQVRVLWQVRRPFTEEVATPQWPTGIDVRTFVPGQDEDRWIACNAKAFAQHSEQGSWTRADLERREREPWFDPAGFFLAVRSGDDGPASALAGFHWTKVHPATNDEPALGEVYVIGVDPDAQGGGLGRALLFQGLRHLRARGLETVMLYVDEDNVVAMTLYERMGFIRVRADVMFEAP